MRLLGTMLGSSVPAERHEAGRYYGVAMEEILNSWTMTELAGLSLFGSKPDPEHAFYAADTRRIASHEWSWNDLGAGGEGRGRR